MENHYTSRNTNLASQYIVHKYIYTRVVSFPYSCFVYRSLREEGLAMQESILQKMHTVMLILLVVPQYSPTWRCQHVSAPRNSAHVLDHARDFWNLKSTEREVLNNVYSREENNRGNCNKYGSTKGNSEEFYFSNAKNSGTHSAKQGPLEARVSDALCRNA